jgi:hypothetical protein
MKHIETRVYRDYQYREIGALEPWNVLLDIHNAIVYGFSQYRLPEPGRLIDIEESESHVLNIQSEWEAEAKKRDLDHNWTGSPPFSNLSTNAKLYLHSVLKDAWHTSSTDERNFNEG